LTGAEPSRNMRSHPTRFLKRTMRPRQLHDGYFLPEANFKQ
jgi:hypothetical protein